MHTISYPFVFPTAKDGDGGHQRVGDILNDKFRFSRCRRDFVATQQAVRGEIYQVTSED